MFNGNFERSLICEVVYYEKSFSQDCYYENLMFFIKISHKIHLSCHKAYFDKCVLVKTKCSRQYETGLTHFLYE